MKRIALIMIVIALVLMAIGSQAKPTPYWRGRHKSGDGAVYTYSKPNWGASYGCVGVYGRLPMKDKNFKRYHFYRHKATPRHPKIHKRRR